MTPLIRDAVKMVAAIEGRANPGFKVTDVAWFDASNAIKNYPNANPTQLLLNPPPFNKFIICAKAVTQQTSSFMLLVIDDGELAIVSGWALGQTKYEHLKQFTYVRKDGKLYNPEFENEKVLDVTEASAAHKKHMSGLLAMFYAGLQEGSAVGYKASVKNTYTNQRLRKKGKPLQYDWTTVTIEPPKPKGESQGGTHASPRLHDRRGHWRNTRSGKRVWVKQCKVGDPSRGSVFHDYRFKQTKEKMNECL